MIGYKKRTVILIIGMIALLGLVDCGKERQNMAACLKKIDKGDWMLSSILRTEKLGEEEPS